MKASRTGYAAAMFAVLLTGSAYGSSPGAQRILTVTGTGGYVDVTLSATTSLDSDSNLTALRGGRQYVGFCFVPFFAADRDRGVAASAPCLARVAAFSQRNLKTFLGTAQLRPGRYRLYLFADGAATITLPLSGLRRSETLTARGKAPVAVLSASETGFGPEIGRYRQSTLLSKTSVNWVGWRFQGVSPAVASHTDMCDVPAGQQCFSGIDTGGPGSSFSAIGVYGGGGWTIYGGSGPDGNPEFLGPRDTFLTNAATDVDASVLEFTLRVDFSPGPPAS